MRTALEMIAHERERQVKQEGWTLEHDDDHQSGELAQAAGAYALHAAEWFDEIEPDCWPWSGSSWKPKDPLTDLVRAGALILAEIERRLRAGEEPPKRP